MVSDFLADWHEHGTDVLARVRMTDPATYLRVAAVLVPKEMNVAVQQATPGNLSPDEWQVLVDPVRLIKANAPEGANALPSDIAPALEETVRVHFAKVITAE